MFINPNKNGKNALVKELLEGIQLPVECMTPESVVAQIMAGLSGQERFEWYMLDSSWLELLGLYRNIYIAASKARSPIETQGYIISFIIQKNTITSGYIPFFQLLDTMSLCRRAPGTAVLEVAKKSDAFIRGLTSDEKKLLVQLSRKYPPCVRSFLSIVLITMEEKKLSAKISETLNPQTFKKYNSSIGCFIRKTPGA